MHTGVDWAAPTGTPIAAAGDEGRAAVVALIDEYIGWAGPLDELVSLREQIEPDGPPPP